MNSKKRKKNKINKKRLMIVILILILVFIVLFATYSYLKEKEKKEKAQFKKIDKTYEEKIQEIDVYVNNLYELVKLSNREIEISNYTDEVGILVRSGLKVIYDDTANLSEKEIKDFYEENKDDIFEQCGIESYEVYKLMADKVKIYKDDIKPTEMSIVTNSCYTEGDYIISTLKIKYDNGAELEIKLKFANSGKISYPYLRIQGD